MPMERSLGSSGWAGRERPRSPDKGPLGASGVQHEPSVAEGGAFLAMRGPHVCPADRLGSLRLSITGKRGACGTTSSPKANPRQPISQQDSEPSLAAGRSRATRPPGRPTAGRDPPNRHSREKRHR